MPIRKKGYLLIAGSLNFFIAMVHIMTVFVGAPAHHFLDPQKFTIYLELGSKYPAYLTVLPIGACLIAALYALCAAGSKIRLPFQFWVLKFLTIAFILRGLAIFWFIFRQIKTPDGTFLREIVFSSCALVIGGLYWMGTSKGPRGQSIGSQQV